MATNFRVKIGKIGHSFSFVALAFRKGLQYRHSGFEMFISDYLATSFKTLVNFGRVIPELKRVKCVHPLVDQQLGYAAPVLDLAGISTEFSGSITTQFCFSFSLGASLLCRAGHTIGPATHF